MSFYRERGLHITCTDEVARTSPFMEEIVLHGKGSFDLVAELDTFAQQLTTQLRAARNHSVLVADKTLISVVAYARLLLPQQDAPVVDAMLQLCVATASLYDAIVYASDTFNPRQPGGAFRVKVADQQLDIDEALRRTAAHAGLALIDIPHGLTTTERVRWISAHLEQTGLVVY